MIIGKNKTKSKKALSLAIAVAVLITATICAYSLINLKDSSSSQKLVLPIYAKGIKAEGKSIDVKGSQIFLDGKLLDPKIDKSDYLRYLPYVNFYVLTKTQPLFGSEEIDADKLKASLENLEEKQNDLKKTLNLSQDVVPINFMKTIPEVSELDQSYLANPSTENAVKLISGYRSALSLYCSDTKALLSNFEKYYPGSSEQSFNFFSSITTNKIIINDLQLALQNVDVLEREINNRETMLTGKSVNVEQITKPNLSEYRTYTPPKLLDKNGALAVDPEYTALLRGPYIVNTSCFADINSDKYFYVYDQKLYGKSIFMPKQADENYYMKTSNNNDSTGEATGYNGYALYLEGNSYRCNDLTYQTKLLMIDQFQQKYGKIKVSDELSDAKFSALKDFEDRYYKDTYKSFDNLNSLKNYYLSAYFSTISEQKYADVSAELLDRYNFINNQLSGIDKITDSTFFINFMNTFYQSQKTLESGIPKYLTTRSSYSITLFDFSPAVWRLSTKPSYLLQNINQSEIRKPTTYTDLVKTLGPDFLAKVNQFKSSIHAQALE